MVVAGQRERRNSMSWDEFYESMEKPAYKVGNFECLRRS